MYGTKTHRFAYAEPALQQFPPETWHLFKPAKGCVFLAADFKQLEARLLAYLSGDQPSIEVFEAGEDIHVSNTIDLFGWTPVEYAGFSTEKRKASRGTGKSFLYGIGYGGEAETLKEKTYCPCPKCIDKMPPTFQLKRTQMRDAQDRWYAKHPAVREFHAFLEKQVRQHQYYESPLFGLRRYVTQPWGRDLERETKNLPMQMTAAALMNHCQVRLHERGAPIVLQRHDEFMLEVPEGDVDHWSNTVREVMETPVEDLGGVSFPVHVEVGDSWGNLCPL